MVDQARVSSIDALERFRANLIVFATASNQCIDEASDEIRRMRSWISDDRRHHWTLEIRRRTKALGQAEQELLAARLSNLKDSTTLQENGVRKAREALRDAEEKLQKVKLWAQRFEQLIEPLAKRLSSLRHTLGHDIPKALAFLVRAQTTLADYSESSLRPPQKVIGSKAEETDPPTSNT